MTTTTTTGTQTTTTLPTTTTTLTTIPTATQTTTIETRPAATAATTSKKFGIKSIETSFLGLLQPFCLFFRTHGSNNRIWVGKRKRRKRSLKKD